VKIRKTSWSCRKSNPSYWNTYSSTVLGSTWLVIPICSRETFGSITHPSHLIWRCETICDSSLKDLVAWRMDEYNLWRGKRRIRSGGKGLGGEFPYSDVPKNRFRWYAQSHTNIWLVQTADFNSIDRRSAWSCTPHTHTHPVTYRSFWQSEVSGQAEYWHLTPTLIQLHTGRSDSLRFPDQDFMCINPPTPLHLTLMDFK
jgi:hypothetical protein